MVPFNAGRMPAVLGVLPLIVACAQEPAPLPRGTALPPPNSPRWEAAPVPSRAADEFAARQGRALEAQSFGPGGGSGLASMPGVGADQTVAPIPETPLSELR